MKVRGPTRQITKMLGALGATPVGMPLPQIPDALSKGTIDGCVIPWEVVPSVKVHELTKFHTEFAGQRPALYTTTFVMAMNKAKYDGLRARPEEGDRRQLGPGDLGLARQDAAGQRPDRPQGGDRPRQHDLHAQRRRSAGIHQALGTRSTTNGSPT